MDIKKYADQHSTIRAQIQQLRGLVLQGCETNAAAIAAQLTEMAKEIKAHLAAEDFLLYPAFRRASNPDVVALGVKFQADMVDLSSNFRRFVECWADADAIAAGPEEFRAAANLVFRALHERMEREDAELYPQAVSVA